jgi:hyperosmotically inducible periplasmic protein
MSTQLSSITLVLTAGLLLMAGAVRAELDPPMTLDPPINLVANEALEDTQRNVRDKAGTTLTPDDHSQTEGDINITAGIRKAVVNDESLSINAHNVKIITSNGVVTLRGPVESKAESMRLQQIAKKMSGVVRIDNQLDIKAP